MDMKTPRTIWKFPLCIEDTQTLQLPKGYEVLSVGLDPKGTPSIWALVNPSADMEETIILCFGTGHTVDEPVGKFLGTVRQEFFVWHFFLS